MSYTPTGTTAGTVPILGSGGTIAPARLGSGSAAGKVLYGDGVFSSPNPLPGPLELSSLFSFGHSYLVAANTKAWPLRIQKRAGAGTITNNYMNGGSWGQTTFDRVVGRGTTARWTPNTPGCVFIQGLHNSINSFEKAGRTSGPYTVAEQDAWKSAIRTTLRGFRYDAFYNYTDASISSSWSVYNSDSLYPANTTDLLTITTTKTKVAIAFLPWDGPTTPAVAAISINGAAEVQYPIVGSAAAGRVSIVLPTMPAGTNTITVRKVSGSTWVSGYMSLSATTFPSIILCGEGGTLARTGLAGAEITNANANQATVNGLFATVAAESEFADMNIIAVDPSPAWNPATMLQADGIHPNPLGTWVIANAMQVGAAGLLPTMSLMGP